jgi:hypothetical protein
MHTEVTNLPNLSGFLRFGRNLPVVRFADTYNNLPDVAPAFIERQTPPIRLPLGKTIIARAKQDAQAREEAEQRQKREPPPKKTEPQPDLFTPQQPQPDQGKVEPQKNDAEQQPPKTPSQATIDDLLLGAAQGDMRVPLQSHARRDGPREKAKPA